MMRAHNRTRLASRVRLVATIGTLALAGCVSSITDSLLDPQQPGVITPEDVEAAGSTGADALRIGALGRLRLWTAGGGDVNQENIMMVSDMLTDVWKSSDTFTQRNDWDRRAIKTNDGVLNTAYSNMTRSRGYFRVAIDALNPSTATDKNSKIAEMYFALGYTEYHMAEYFCNGIPLGETVNGVITYTKPLTNQEVYALAIAHLDSAISLAGTTTLGVSVKNAALVAKARALMNVSQGSYAAAAALVGSVQTSYQYTMTYSQATQSNEIWALNATRSNARYAVGDSSDHVTTRIINALPFASAADPRVPVTGSSAASSPKGIDNLTPWVGQLIWTARETPVVLASGVDARLVEAEAKMFAGDYPGMTAILNALRTSTPTLGTFKPANMAALAAPTTRDAAINLLFREKAFWQFARGARLGDLRRLIRQYGRTEAQVFPTGQFHKEGLPYGTDVNLPVTDPEKTNPNFTGCIDRNA